MQTIGKVALAVLCAVAATGANDRSERFDLVCLGAGSANKFTSTQANVWTNSGDYASANVIGNRSVPFDDQVNLWVAGNTGRIRMPRIMLPPLHGGEDGWFEIRSVEIGANEITGSVAVNFLNKPKLRIDRLTGRISLSGKAGDYSGTCQKYDPATVERAF